MLEKLGLLLLVVGVLLAPCAHASLLDLGDRHFETVGDAQSIPDNNVTTLIQDAQGYLWIGTPSGLIRYDGYRFARYVRDPDDPASLGGSFIRTLLLARDGRLWIGTDADGVSIHDPATGKFSHLRHDPNAADTLASDNVRALAEDEHGGIYIGTRAGIAYWTPGSHRVRRLARHLGAATTRLDERILTLLLDGRGDLWAGSWNGLARLRKGSEQFERVLSGEGELLASQLILTLFPLADGRIALSTTQLGGFILDAASLAARPIAIGMDAQVSASDATVLAMLQPVPNELWLGGFGGIVIVDPASGVVLRQLRTDPAVASSLAHTQVRSFLQDASGQIWIGGYSGGLQRHDPANAAVRVLHHSPLRAGTLSHPSISSLLELADGNIWVGTRANGIDIIDPARGVVGGLRPSPEDPTALGNGIVIALEQTLDGTVWAGTLAGLFRTDPVRRQFESFGPGEGLVGTTVRRLLRARDGGLYIGSNAGLSRWSPEAPRAITAVLAGNEPIPAEVNALVTDAAQRLWVGSTIGLYVLEPGEASLRVVHVQDPAHRRALTSIVGLLVSRAGDIFVDTPEGLFRVRHWDGQHAVFEAISQTLGIAGQPFGANLLEDSQGRIWSQRHVYDRATASVYELGPADGVDIGTAWFRAYEQTADGHLLFGGSKGLLLVDPARFQRWTFAPPVVVTELKVDGKARTPAQGAHLVLAPGDRSFSAEFAALDFSAPTRNRYEYRLDGYDSEFIAADAGHRVASYSNLRPGDYTLQIRGSGRTGAWSPMSVALPVRVLPRYWQTTWFALLMAVAGIALLYALFNRHAAGLKRRQRELQQMVHERTAELSQAKEKAETALMQLQGAQRQLVVAEKMASLGQLVAGVAHEINTPLGIALTASSMLSDEVAGLKRSLAAHTMRAGDVAIYIELAERASALVDSNLARAAHLVRSFKQVSVDRSLDERRRFDLYEYLKDLVDSLELSWKNRPITLELHCPPGLLLDSYPGTLGQVIGVFTQNALLHAFAPEQPGRMSLIAAAGADDSIVLSFVDDGLGIAAVDLPRVFEPFFTTRRAQGSTGLGLHIVFNLVSARLGGHVEVYSVPGQGTRFVLVFPRVAPG